MPPKLAHGLRACCVAVAFALATVDAAEPTPAPSPIGMTREQVLTRYGEPKSQIAAGNRVVMFFAKDRLVLRDGVVVEAERLPGETTPRRAAPAESAPVASPTTERTGAATPAPMAQPVATSTPSAPIEGLDPNAPVLPAPQAQPAPPPPPAPEPKLEIKLVRPPSANYTRPAPKQETSPAQPAAPVLPTQAPARPPVADAGAAKGTPPAATKSVAPGVPVQTTTPPSSSGGSSVATTVRDSPAATEPDPSAEETAKEDSAAVKAAKEKKKKLRSVNARRRIEEAGEDEPDITEAFFTTRTFVIAFLVVGGGLGYLAWRIKQRQLELAATAVSRTPFSAPLTSTAGGGAVFNPNLLAKLEWKRFEELVVAYYVKTGVVAVRTKSGPATPVHIKISWKGEPRPFACVQCIPHPQGLVDAKPLQNLVAVLAAEDIRRGYVVSAGKFNVNARDYAEEKHITLLPGDIFLEKLNALPDAARNEIMQTIATGDYQTPSCPKCDAKMVKSPDDPAMWRCASHPDQLIPVWQLG